LLAKYEVGLIISGYSYVNPAGKSSQRQQGIYDDRFIGPYRQITGRVHKYSSKIALQIVHGGRQALATPEYPHTLAPSAVKDSSSGITPQAMTGEQIQQTISRERLIISAMIRVLFSTDPPHLSLRWLVYGEIELLSRKPWAT